MTNEEFVIIDKDYGDKCPIEIRDNTNQMIAFRYLKKASNPYCVGFKRLDSLNVDRRTLSCRHYAHGEHVHATPDLWEQLLEFACRKLIEADFVCECEVHSYRGKYARMLVFYKNDKCGDNERAVCDLLQAMGVQNTTLLSVNHAETIANDPSSIWFFNPKDR